MTSQTGHGPVPLTRLEEWASAADPQLRYLAFHTVYVHPGDVPGLSGARRIELCIEFLEEALAGTFGSALPDGPYVWAHTVLGWLNQLSTSKDPNADPAKAAILAMLQRLARSDDQRTREVVLLGVLEHAFDDSELRALFDGWASDPELATLHREALRLSGAIDGGSN
ncbi:hypothetical protein [Mycobacterium sp. 050134]|uniref:hypothetical protein n=1 Tax=Mycobacterium sp. 050134 TaxID=3096111 RepID=UPI002ED8562A